MGKGNENNGKIVRTTISYIFTIRWEKINVSEQETEEGRQYGIGTYLGIGIVIILVIVGFLLVIPSGGIDTKVITSDSESVEVEQAVKVFNMPLGTNSSDVITVPWKNSDLGLMHRGLFLADSAFESTRPDLAESLEISRDGLTYTIQMKEGIKWSDGMDLTIDDVIFSFEWVLLADAVNGLYTTAFLNIEGASEYQENPSIGLAGVMAEDNTLIIQLNTPYPALEQVLAQFTILPKHVLEETDMLLINDNEEYWANPIVCGMYQVDKVELVSEGSITLVQNQYYEGVKPQIEEVVFLSNASDFDYIATNNIEEIISYRAISKLEEYQIDVLFYRYFIFNMSGVDGVENTAMQDPLVRKAIGYAINREELLRKVYLNTGTLINTGVPMSHSAYVDLDSDIEYNLEKAKELLAQSQYDINRPLRLTYYYSDDISMNFMEEVAANLKEVGFTVELFKVGAGSELYNEREYDLALKGLSAFSLLEWYAEYDDDNVNFKNIFGGTTDFEPYINALSSAVDPNEIDSILVELQNLEDELYFKVPLFTLNHSVFINKEKVSIPTDVTFGNTFYRQDVKFEEWTMK